MKTLRLPPSLFDELIQFLFQNELEQGGFLFAKPIGNELLVEDVYLIPPDGWLVQLDVYLEMKDTERAKVMNIARQGGWSVIDCHSHPGSNDDVWFSPSDIAGISGFAAYAKWKLSGLPYVAAVWGEKSVDAVLWRGDFSQAQRLDEIRIARPGGDLILIPRGTWFQEPRAYWRKERPRFGR